MMSKRERVLSLAVLGIVGCYGLFLVVQRTFLSPLNAQAIELNKLNTSIASSKKEVDRAIRATEKIAEWEKRSLPPDEGDAKALYQEYLFKLGRDCRIPEADYSVNTLKVQPGKYFTQIPFNIRGKTSLENLTDLLYAFEAHKKTILHEIRSATVNRVDSGGKVQFDLEVVALALKSAPSRNQLVPDDFKPILDDEPRDAYKLITSKNIFEPYREPRREPERPSDPAIDAAEHIVFTGFTHTGDEPVAWFYNRLTKDNRQYRTGDELDMGGVHGTFVRISPSTVIIEKDEKQWNLKLGRRLKELTLIARDGAPAKSDGDKSVVDDKDSDKSKAENPAASSEDDDKPTTTAVDPAPPDTTDEKREKLRDSEVTIQKTTASTDGERKVKPVD